MAKMTVKSMTAFRQKYRGDIHQFYSGWWHVLSVFGLGLSVIGYSLFQLEEVSIGEWMLFPVVMLLMNFAEYYSHRWLGHVKKPWARFIYERHTGDHHTFFMEDYMDYESTRDWRVVFFPTHLIIGFILLLALPGGYIIQQLLSANAGYLFAAATLSAYLFYELMHFSFHIPHGSKLQRLFLCIPGWKQMRHTHVLHHKREIMTYKNFNITLPIFDILLNTIEWQPISEFEAEQAQRKKRS
jgi:hypothetical protein